VTPGVEDGGTQIVTSTGASEDAEVHPCALAGIAPVGGVSALPGPEVSSARPVARVVMVGAR
jgi:hypothetical protein